MYFNVRFGDLLRTLSWNIAKQFRSNFCLYSFLLFANLRRRMEHIVFPRSRISLNTAPDAAGRPFEIALLPNIGILKVLWHLSHELGHLRYPSRTWSNDFVIGISCPVLWIGLAVRIPVCHTFPMPITISVIHQPIDAIEFVLKYT